MSELRGLDAWIEGRHITKDPRSPYYDGPEFDEEEYEEDLAERQAEAKAEARFAEKHGGGL